MTNALAEAAHNGDIETMRELLGKGADVDAGALCVAAEKGHLLGVYLLLGYGANVKRC
jgi:ankyrin repeat protein